MFILIPNTYLIIDKKTDDWILLKLVVFIEAVETYKFIYI